MNKFFPFVTYHNITTPYLLAKPPLSYLSHLVVICVWLQYAVVGRPR